MSRVMDVVSDAFVLLDKIEQELAEARTQDDFHRVEVKVQIAQAYALCAIAERLYDKADLR